jgi:hypothetical protein
MWKTKRSLFTVFDTAKRQKKNDFYSLFTMMFIYILLLSIISWLCILFSSQYIDKFEIRIVQCLLQKSLANLRVLRSNLSRRHWWDSSDERLIQLTKQTWSFLRTAKHFVSYHFFFRHFDHFRRRVNRETHQEIEIQWKCEVYTRIDESREDIFQRSEYSRCFHRQFRRFSLFDREYQSIIEKNHFVWRKNLNAYRCETNVD